jgi:hypothetical protein
MSGTTTNWALPYAAGVDPSNPNLWQQSQALANQLESIMNGSTGRAFTNITPAAGFTAGGLGCRALPILRFAVLSGSIVMTTPGILNDTLIGTLPAGTGLFGSTLHGGGAVLLGTTRSPNVVLRITTTELRATTTANTNEVFLNGVWYQVA